MRKLRCHRHVTAELLLYQVMPSFEILGCDLSKIEGTVIRNKMTIVVEGSTRS
jgi:hypothetical protein